MIGSVGWIYCGCTPQSPSEVVVYTALDREFSEPLLVAYEQQSNVRVLPKYDVESNKTVGLANELLASSGRGRADLFWNNEILHTIRLEKAGRLVPYLSREAEHYPAQFRSQQGLWHGFAARARVFIVNTKILPDSSQWPRSIAELADPRWSGRCALAKPLFGTTATHAAVLFDTWGPGRARDFFERVKKNAKLEGGNKRVAVAVGRGEYAWGWTDTDDAIIELENGQPVSIVFPDQEEGGLGTLLIPNTLGIIANGPNRAAAEALVEHLLSAETEGRLAGAASAQIPLHRHSKSQSRVAREPFKVMEVDFYRAAAAWDEASVWLQQEFK
jgi:iron(III) transport system substrate-binding protein